MIQGTFIPPNKQTGEEFIYDFVSLYWEKKWGVSMYNSSCSLIANYINPIIGSLSVQEITPKAADKYIQTLQKTAPVLRRNRQPKREYLSSQNIEKIVKLLRCAFKQAVRWEMIAKNPFENAVLPKVEYAKRDIWTAETIRQALDGCTDSKLYIAMNLAFACSLRVGEILGLQWCNVHISDEDIAADNAYIYIEKELTREWEKAQNELKQFLGSEYQDYDLVVSLPNGRPCESRLIDKALEKLKEELGLPKVVFHSLRHSSTTYKLNQPRRFKSHAGRYRTR